MLLIFHTENLANIFYRYFYVSITAYDIKHDMQVLLILILTYNIYFGCIIYEILKFSTVKAFALRVPENYKMVSLDNFDNTSKSNEKSHMEIYWRPCHDFMQRFIANKLPQMNIEELKLQRCCKNARIAYPYFHTNTSRMHKRKLLDYEKNFCERPAKYHKSNKMHRDITATKKTAMRRKRNIVAKDSQLNDEVLETWDNWSNWSTCSVTCGQGQQVRWRHCLSENCIKGLKKAQLKSCHFKDCDTKGFLGWLGIKP